jgi:hypothetical protein
MIAKETDPQTALSNPALARLQAFVGTFSDDDRSITDRWEKSADGALWEYDFDLTYTKVG